MFPLADDYTFSILQSILHWEWFMARCSTSLRALRRGIMMTSDLSLREIGHILILDKAGKYSLRDVQEMLDRAVRDSYCTKKTTIFRVLLLNLSAQCAARKNAPRVKRSR